MDPEDQKLLKRVVALTEENNVILRKLHRAEKMRRLFRALYWVAVIALALGAYYVIQPYLDSLRDLYGSIRGGVENIGATNPLDLLKGGGGGTSSSQ